jgi:probable rRNA maturation factor
MLGVKRCAWTITIVGDGAMAELHARTMDLPTTTDVLTFDMRDETGGTREGAAVELDTVVCADEARRRAEEMGHGVREELLLYAVHSLLHVQGYDDVTAAKARRMHKREDELLEALGVGAVYARKGEKR